MATTGVLCSDTNVKDKAGPTRISSSIDSGDTAETNFFIDLAEGVICLETRYDWVTNYASVSAIGKDALREAASSYAAIMAINYDKSLFASQAHATDTINVLWAQYRQVMDLILKDNNYKEFILSGEGDID